MCDALIDNGNSVMAVEGFKMGAGNLEIGDAIVAVDSLEEQADGILDKLGLLSVQFGKGLFILPADKDLCLGEEGLGAEMLQLLEGDGFTWAELDADARLAPLRMRNSVHFTVLAGMFGELRGAGAGGAVNKIEMHPFPEAAEVVKNTLVGGVIILVTLQIAAEALHDHRVAEAQLETGPAGTEAVLVGNEDILKKFGGENTLLELIKDPHDAGHVDALAVRGEGHRSGHAGLKVERMTTCGHEPQREAKIRYAHLIDGNICAENFGSLAVLRVREGVMRFGFHDDK